MARVGFVGLGVMGAPMAEHLTRDHKVTVWNRTPSKAAGLKGVEAADTLAQITETSDIVFLCVRGSEDVIEVMDRLLETAAPGTLFVDHSTIAPEAARRVHASTAKRGCRFVDAPVTGGSVGAKNGQLTIFLGGSEADCEEARLAMSPYTKRAERVGDAGMGQTMKLANQIAVGGALQALCETLAFAEAAGLDMAQARAMIGGGSGGSWAFENYGPKVLNRDWSPGFSIANQRKDFGYTREAAAEIGANIPGTELVDLLLSQLDEDGRGEETTAALFEVLSVKR